MDNLPGAGGSEAHRLLLLGIFLLFCPNNRFLAVTG